MNARAPINALHLKQGTDTHGHRESEENSSLLSKYLLYYHNIDNIFPSSENPIT